MEPGRFRIWKLEERGREGREGRLVEEALEVLFMRNTSGVLQPPSSSPGSSP